MMKMMRRRSCVYAQRKRRSAVVQLEAGVRAGDRKGEVMRGAKSTLEERAGDGPR
jgi:hypothetical protein